MPKRLKKIGLAAFILPAAFLIITSTTAAQSPALPDSLHSMLHYLAENTKDGKLREALAEAQSQHAGGINSSLLKKLIAIEELLVNTSINRQTILAFDEMVLQLSQSLPPRKHHPYYAASLTNLAFVYESIGRYGQALQAAKQAWTIRKQPGQERSGYALSLACMANIYDSRSEYEKALPLLLKATSIMKKALGPGHPLYATCLHNLAVLYDDLGEDKKALPLFQKALAIRKSTAGTESAAYAESLDRMAVMYERMGQYALSLSLAQQALAIEKAVLGEEHPVCANTFTSLYIVYEDMGQYDKALPMVTAALAIREKVLGEESPKYAESLNNLAGLYESMGQYDKALPLYQQESAVVEKTLGKQHADYAYSLNDLAYLYEDMGQYEKAMHLYEEALEIRRKKLGTQHPYYASSLGNLAALHASMKNYGKALSLLQQAVTIRKKVSGEDADYAIAINNLARVYYLKGDYKTSLSYYQQALAIRKKTAGEDAYYATCLNNVAALFQDRGQYNAAFPYYTKAIAIRKKMLGEAHPDYLASLAGLASLHAAAGSSREAADLLRQVSDGKLKYLFQTYTTLSEPEKMTIVNREAAAFYYLPSLLYTQKKTDASFCNQVYRNELALKGMVLENQQVTVSSMRTSKDSAALQLYEAWRANKSFLGKQRLLPVAERIADFDSLQEAGTRLEQQLSRRSASFHAQLYARDLTAATIAGKLQKGEAAIEFIRFPLYNKKWTDSVMYAALLLLPRDSNARFIPLFEEKELRHFLQRFTGSATAERGMVARPGKAADSLYQLIWKPLEQYLTNTQTIFYAPAGLLHRIAFNALPADTAHLLIDKYRLSQVLSTRSVALPARVALRPGSLSAWGNIAYDLPYAHRDVATNRSTRGMREEADPPRATAPGAQSTFLLYNEDNRELRKGGWYPLPETKNEIDTLQQLFTDSGIAVTVRSDTAAGEEAFKALDGKGPQLLHLATHGFFLPVKESRPKNSTGAANKFTIQQDPLFRSGLVLAGGNAAWLEEGSPTGKEDGILTAYEIAQLDLSGTDLVVLSACETALGDIAGNEGVLGLQRALKLAGVKQMIISLWRVSDKATMELMALFYKNQLAGMAAREALRQAQLAIKQRYKYPYYWAAFVLVE